MQLNFLSVIRYPFRFVIHTNFIHRMATTSITDLPQRGPAGRDDARGFGLCADVVQPLADLYPVGDEGNVAHLTAQHHVEHCAIALDVVTQAFGQRQYPLANWQVRKNMIGEVGCSLCHAPGVAGGAYATGFAEK